MPLVSQSASAAVCVENASEDAWLFIAHSDDGPREIAELAPGAALCSEGSAKGTVAVFAGQDEIEGCSRRVPANTTERMIRFPHVDLCAWERKP